MARAGEGDESVALIDIGNSNVVVAITTDGVIGPTFRLPTEPSWTADFYEITLRALASDDERRAAFTAVRSVALASTSPALTDRMARAAARVFNCDVINLNAHRLDLGIEIDIDTPAEAGVDRIVNALAARERYGAPSIVVDIGTGTTFDVVGQSGAYIGGAIAAGPNLSLDSLHRVAAQLPKIDITRPDHVIGRSSKGAMRSGFFWAYVGMIQYMCRRIIEELGTPPEQTPVIISGGYAETFLSSFDMPAHLDREITLRGLLMAHAHVRAARR